MALITRVSRLFRADLHAVLDHIEEPDLLLRQSLREMEACFASDEQQLRLLKHEADQFQERVEAFEHAIQEMDEELDICFYSQQEDLARSLIRKKLESRHYLKLATERLTASRKGCSALEQKLSQQRAQLESVRQKVALLQDESRLDATGLHEAGVSDDEVEIAFLKEKQRRSHS